jgi:hypothetical protein
MYAASFSPYVIISQNTLRDYLCINLLVHYFVHSIKYVLSFYCISCLFALCVFSLVICSALLHVFKLLFFFLVLSFKSSFYILHMGQISEFVFCKYFCPICGLSSFINYFSISEKFSFNNKTTSWVSFHELYFRCI